jgi:tetratricopeptide (TPR) repeat protein
MPEKVIPLMLLFLMVVASTEIVFEQKELYDISNDISTISALWAGDIDNDGSPEILVGGIIYEEAISKGVVVSVKEKNITTLARVPGTSRTVYMVVCNALEAKDREIVVGSHGLFVYSKSGKTLTDKNVDGDVTALLSIPGDPLDDIVYGTTKGEVVYLTGFEDEKRHSVEKEVKFIQHREGNTFYVVTQNSIRCLNNDLETVWGPVTVERIINHAVSYDMNDDSVKELIYISGNSVYSLSSDGTKSTLVLTPSVTPFSLLVEELTGDENPDVVLADNARHIDVYSDFKTKVQSLFAGEGEAVFPIMFAAHITGDEKIDLIYGGITDVIVFENVVPSEKLVTRAEQIFKEGQELLDQREYGRARAKFEEAEQIFLLVEREERASQCRDLIDDINKIIEKKSTAEAALDKGQGFLEEDKYQEAKTEFQTAVENYEYLAEKDDFYSSFLRQAESLVVRCDEEIADRHYQQGEDLFNQEKYQEALVEYEKAEEIYSQLGSSKIQKPRERIKEIEEILKEEPEPGYTDLFVYGSILGIIAIALGIFFATRKKVSVRLEKGHVYLLLESQPKRGFQLLKEYNRIGYSGMVISRLPPDQIRKKGLKKQKILQFSTASREDSIPPDNVVNILLKMKEFMTSKDNTIILLDGLDYIIIQNTFEDAFSLIQKIAESVILYKGIVLVTLNPKSVEERELVLLEGEMELLTP